MTEILGISPGDDLGPPAPPGRECARGDQRGDRGPGYRQAHRTATSITVFARATDSRPGRRRSREPLAERPPAAAYGALHLTAEILAALGHYATRRAVSLTALRVGASSTVIGLRTRSPFAAEAEIFLTHQILHLEGEALMPIWQARRAGKSEEILLCAAGMVLELWEFADQLRQSPETSPGAISHANGWASPAAAKILRKLTLGAAVAAVVPDGGLMRAFRPPAVHSGQKKAWHKSEQHRTT